MDTQRAEKNDAKYVAREFSRIDKELDDLYHEVALKMGVSDSAFTIFYIIGELGDGCMQRDICCRAYASKQTIHSSIRRLEEEGYLYLRQGKGRDKHIFLTRKGKTFMEQCICPVMQMEEEAFGDMEPEERGQYLRLAEKYVSGLCRRMKTISSRQD